MVAGEWEWGGVRKAEDQRANTSISEVDFNLMCLCQPSVSSSAKWGCLSQQMVPGPSDRVNGGCVQFHFCLSDKFF